MTLHDSCHGSMSWVAKTTDELVAEGDLTSSDFELDLGSFTNIRNVDDSSNHATGWKTFTDLTSPSADDMDRNNNCKNVLISSHPQYKSPNSDEQNMKLREIGHISPLHSTNSLYERHSQDQPTSSPNDVLTHHEVAPPHLVTSHAEWMSLVASMNLTQLYDGTTTPFQYILGAATTPATKINEESLTYLNQGQSYEIKLKRLTDTPGANETEQYLKSIVRVVFHERRLQYMEREQLETWRRTRPGERILDIDIPLSYGLLDVKIDPQQLSSLEFIWDARREGGIFIKINAISTEFTARRHGGEKGVPFRVQVETYTLHGGDEPPRLLHCASCQVKVFKPKGADRKHKTDREKLEKRSDAEREKYQPSFECTVLTEIPLEQVKGYLEQLYVYKPGITDSHIGKDMAPTPTPTTSVLNNSINSLLGQFGSSSQLCSVASTVSPPNANSSDSNTLTPTLMDLPPAASFPAALVSTVSNTTSSGMSHMNFTDIKRDSMIGNRHAYDSQSPLSSPSPRATPCISVTVSQGMSFINMSGSRESLLSQTGRKSLLSPTPMNAFQQQLALPSTAEVTQEEKAKRSTNQQASGVRQTSSLHDSQPTLTSPPMTLTLTPSSSSQQVVQWLNCHRFSHFVQDFQNFSGADLLRLSRDELIQICGVADGIRLDNALQAKHIRPKLTIYVCQESDSDRPRSTGIRCSSRHGSDSQWDILSPAGSPSCSSPYPSSSHLSSCSSDPSLPTTNQLSPRISSSCNSYLDRRRGSVQLPAVTGRTASNFLSAKRRFGKTNDSSAEDDGLNGNFRKKQRTRDIDFNQIEGYCAVYLEVCTVCHLADKLAALFNIDVSLLDDLYYRGPSGVNVLITDSVVQNFVDHARYAIEVIHPDDASPGQYRLLLKYMER